MRKLLLFFSIQLLSAAVNAQSIKYGAKAAFIQNDLSKGSSGTGTPSDFLSNNDIFLGLLIEKKLSNKLSIQPELNYKIKRASNLYYELSENSANGQRFIVEQVANQLYAFHYLELPVLAKFKPIKYLNVYTGPSVSYAIINSTKTSISTNYYDYDSGYFAGSDKSEVNYSDEQKKKYLNNLEFAWQFGLGFEYRKFELSANYQKSFTSVFKDPDHQYSSTPKFQSIFIAFAYRFQSFK